MRPAADEPVRTRRLRSEYRRLQELASESDNFLIEEALGDPPEIYVVAFQCKGVAGPTGVPASFSDLHRVRISLGQSFPLQRPGLEWLTPIFHPNVSADGKMVCISQWYATQFLDNLCTMLWRMIQYRNFDPYNPLNLRAAEWALAHGSLFPLDNRPLRHAVAPAAPATEAWVRIL